MKLQVIFHFFLTFLILEISQTNPTNGSKTNLNKVQNPSKWLQRIITSVKKDPKVYQIFLITNDFENCGNVRKIQKEVPILYFSDNYTKREIQHLEQRNSLSNPRDTTLFVIDEAQRNDNMEWIEEMMTFIKNLTNVRIRPKCLIVRYLDANRTSNYENFLEKQWENLFLDLTILDVTKHGAMVHRLNPFVSYTKKAFTKRTVLFPSKLRNLNGYPVKVGILNSPPNVILKRNSTGHPYDIRGPDAEVGKIFAKLLNYSQVFVPSDGKERGVFDCENSEKSSHFLKLVQQNKIQLISIISGTTKSVCKREILESLIVSLDHYVAITPNRMSKNYSIIIGNTFYYSILLTILITLFISILVKLFKFDETIWNWTVIIQILFGIGIKTQPKKLNERIIFGCLLIIYFYYSCNILISLTDFNFRPDKDDKISTLTDLIDSGLQFSSEYNKLWGFSKIVKEKKLTTWVKKGRVTTFDECIELLLKYRNITCIMKLSQAEWYTGLLKEKNLVRYVPEFLSTVGVGFILEPGSPFVDRFNQIHRLLMEFALLEKMKLKESSFTKYYKHQSKTEEHLLKLDKNADEWKIQSLLTGILIAGYLSSIISFVFEIILNKRKRKTHPITIWIVEKL